MIGRLVEDGRFDPTDPFSARLELRAFRLVRFQMVRLEMAVDQRVRLARRRLVYVLGRPRRTKQEERRDDESRSNTSQRTKHVAIMAVTGRLVKRASPVYGSISRRACVFLLALRWRMPLPSRIPRAARSLAGLV